MTPKVPEPPTAPSSSALPDLLRKRELASVAQRRLDAGLDAGDPERDAIGLALSGGGIRSATFSVGVLQGLAKLGLLKRVDYLSTVSGGGYCGSFFGRLFTRHPEAQRKAAADAVEAKLQDPGAPEIQWLRENGRYLSPAGATDARLALAVVLRNWVSLLWVVASFLFTFFTFGAVIRLALWHSLDAWRDLEKELASRAGKPIWWSPLIFLPLFPLLLGAVPAGWGYWFTQRGRSLASRMPLVLTWVVILGAAGVLVWNASGKFEELRTHAWWWAMVVLLVGGLLAVLLYWLASTCEKDQEMRVSATRNRLSRWLSLALFATGCAVGAGVVDSLGQTIYALLVTPAVLPSDDPVLSWKGFSALVAALAPLVAAGRGLVRWITQSGGKKKRVSLPSSLIAGAAAGLVVLIVLVVLAVGSHFALWAGGVPKGDPGQEFATRHFDPTPEVGVTPEKNIKVDVPRVVHVPKTPTPPTPRDAPSGAIVVAFGLALLFSALSGRTFAFLNLSSHQSFYGARLTRAYLGASNPDRQGPHARRVTESIVGDDLPFADYQPHERGGPLHLVNVTVNETIGGGSEVLDRDRKGLPMALGPHGVSVGVKHHALWKRPEGTAPIASAGTAQAVKQRRSHSVDAYAVPLATEGFAVFPTEPAPLQLEGLRLGNWMGISGAAFSTGLGTQTSLPLSLLAGVANVRLGYWFDSGIERDARTGGGGTKPSASARLLSWITWAFPVQIQLLEEFVARFHGPARQRWYLTDGGHFENTACYELLRRRVPFIVCCDDGADPDYSFEDLARLVRLARADFRAEIELLDAEKLDHYDLDERAKKRIGPLAQLVRGAKSEYAARRATLAAVRYDGAAEPGTFILFLKPTLTGEEPLDVLEYHVEHDAFPQEPTSDQFFDEAQWESYRKLGEVTAERVFRGKAKPSAPWLPSSLQPPKRKRGAS